MSILTCSIKENTVTWIDLCAPTRTEIEQVSEEYHLNSYAITDSLDPDHLPKYEQHDNIHFFIIRLLHNEDLKLPTVQSVSCKIAVFFTDSFIITVHRTEQPFIKAIMDNEVKRGSITSTEGIAVQIAGQALRTFEQPALVLSDEIDRYESRLFLKENIPDDMIRSIYYLKNRAGLYKKLLLLTNEVLGSLRVESEQRPALRDVRDLHTRLLLLNDQVLDDAHNLLNIYLSLSSHRTNEVMRLLTIFSVFFMPLTFIAGIYGMNFKFMPEIESSLGYPITLIVMLVVSAVIFYGLKEKNGFKIISILKPEVKVQFLL